MFTKNQEGLSLMSLGKQRILSSEDQVLLAEILRCLDIIEGNLHSVLQTVIMANTN